ncbi:MAG: hypothetical protein ACF8MJ_12445 [Phycisphaerales bacterium JB050]
MIQERILITVRTYPNLSTKYQETVCTGGITDKGEWRRLYPVSLRYLDEGSQYSTWDIVTVRVGELSSDGRPESRKCDQHSIKVDGRVESHAARADWVEPTITKSLDEMRSRGLTLAPVKAASVERIEFEADSPEWSPKEQAILEADGLFEKAKPLEKMPFKIWIYWTDSEGNAHKSRSLVWEMMQTWRAYRARYSDPEARLKEAFLARCEASDRLSFFMGNYKMHPQHFAVCGIYCPPKGKVPSEPSFF